jgi:hypothetical protein
MSETGAHPGRWKFRIGCPCDSSCFAFAVPVPRYSSGKKRLHQELRRWVKPENGKQKKRNDKLSRRPERKSEDRDNSVSRPACGAGCFAAMRVSSFTSRGSQVEVHKSRFTSRGSQVDSCHPRPTPTYSNPMARSRTESSRFLVSTMSGFLSRCLIRSKSSARNSGQPVPTTSASIPSAAA